MISRQVSRMPRAAAYIGAMHREIPASPPGDIAPRLRAPDGAATVRRSAAGCTLGFVLLATGAVMAAPAALSDYPTAARADYVFACMKSNGETRQVLEQCSCSVDVIASLLPYERYVTAETVLSLAQAPSRLGAEFRSTESARAAVDDLRRAQAEAEVRCF